MTTATLRKILYPIEFILYFVLFVLSMMNIFGDVNIYSYVQAKTVAINAGAGCIAVFIPLIIELITKKKLSPFIDILIFVDLFVSIFLGEGCQFYLNFVGWDKFLHFFGTAEFALLGYVIAKYALNRLQPDESKSRTKIILSVVFALFFSVACEAMWEICEFTCDSLMGTNMQKYIPDYMYDLVGTDGTLGLTADEIVAFFSTQEGYTYALQDTMFDIITDVGGGIFGCLATALVFHFKPEWQDKVLFRHEKEEAVEAPEPDFVTVGEITASENTVGEISDSHSDTTEEASEQDKDNN